MSATNAMTHCPHAGPTGAGACGMNCQGFCSIVQAACTGANQQYPNQTMCETACAGFMNNAITNYNTNTTSGNSFACRVYHATVAATQGGGQAAVHCPHVVAASPPCQ